MLSEGLKRSLVKVAGQMAVSISEHGALPITIDELTKNFDQVYARLRAIMEDQELHEPKAKHLEAK